MSKTGIGIAAIIIFVIALFIGLAGFDTVDASHKGVKVRFGKIIGTMNPGIQWTGMFTDVNQYSLRTRKVEVTMEGDEGAVDKDGQSVYGRIEVNYRLKGDNVENAYRNIGKDREREYVINIGEIETKKKIGNLEEVLNLDGIIREGFKTTTSQYTSLEIFQKRPEVKTKAITLITENFPADYFILENVVISNIDFNLAFKNAIEQEKTNERLAAAKGKEVDIAKFQADIKIEEARGTAESQKLAADAKAYTVLVGAKAEAEALRLKAKELTPLMVSQNLIDQWSGDMPDYLIIGGGSEPNLLLQTPLLKEGLVNKDDH